MSNLVLRCISILASLAATALPVQAASAVIISADAYAQAGGRGVVEHRTVPLAQAPAVASASEANGSGANPDPGVPAYLQSATAVGRASVGRLGVQATTLYTGTGSNGFTNNEATANAYWADAVTFNAPGHLGLGGTWVGMVQVEGDYSFNTLLAASPGKGQLVLSVTVPGNPVINGFTDNHTCNVADLPTPCLFLPSSTLGPTHFSLTVPMTLNFTYGTPVEFGLSIYPDAVANISRTDNVGVMAEADFSHTLRWDGTTAVLDDAGAAVSNYTLASASGADYRYAADDAHFGIPSAVPEPSTWALLLAGCTVLCGARGARSRWRR